MGVQDNSMGLIQKYAPGLKTVCELGSQNLYHYNNELPWGAYADLFYKQQGYEEYTCIDTNGENNALQINLGEDTWKPEKLFDLVTDFGTSEHIACEGIFSWENIYNCWKIKHDILKLNGIMINENPLTGNYPLHGFYYYTYEFYNKLCDMIGYEVLELGEFVAQSNYKDGNTIYCVIRKVKDCPFISLKDFKTLRLEKV